jgi:hypothetical protein
MLKRGKQLLLFVIFLALLSSLVSAVREWNCSTDDCSGIIGLYHFNVAGSATDSSGNGYNGASGNIGTATGKFGNAYSFGGNSYVTVTRVLSLSAFGISLWVKTTDANRGIFQESNGVIVPAEGPSNRQLNFNNGNICARIYNNEQICTSGTNYADGQWHHIVHTHGTGVGAQRIYVDNVVKAIGSKSTADGYGSSGGFSIGFADDAPLSSYHFFVGSIDELVVYNRALTSTDVANLYNAGVLPAATSFSTSYGSTNFGLVSDLSSIPGVKLASYSGSIKWTNTVNAVDQNFDSNVRIGSGYVSINKTALHSSIDAPAKVNVSVSGCVTYTAYYASGYRSTLAEIKSNGQVCNSTTNPACTNMQCVNNWLSFDVPHFDSYGGEGGGSTPQGGGSGVPEFSSITMILAAVGVVMGFFAVRRRE